MIKDEAYKWLNNNANMYRGNNASDCMIEAFVAGAKLVESKFTSDNSNYAKCYNCGKEFEIEKGLCKECSDFGDGCGA